MQIRQLKILRYRALEAFEWMPRGGVNCLVGAADTGKSTVLSALALLFASRPPGPASEYDFYRRRVEAGFQIQAVVGNLSSDLLSALSDPPLQGWLPGGLQPLPDVNGSEPVLVVRAEGTPDFEIQHSLVADDGTTLDWRPRTRERFLFTSRLSVDDIARNELRLVRGSALDRRLGGESMRPELARVIAEASASVSPPASVVSELASVKADYEAAGIPSEVAIGIVAQEGMSPTGLLGLLEGSDPESRIPLYRAGSGTRRMAVAWLARLAADSGLIVSLDEPEVGLEPYRQRALVARARALAGDTGQVFMTTHSTHVVERLEPGELWQQRREDSPVHLGAMPTRMMRGAPEAFLCRLPVLCEGETEAGLLDVLLPSIAKQRGDPLSDDLGIVPVAREGQPSVLVEARALLDAGISCGLFVDNDPGNSGTRARLAAEAGCAAAVWGPYQNIEDAVASTLPLARLDELVATAMRATHAPERSLRAQLGQAAGRPGEATVAALVAALGEDAARRAVGRAMQDGAWFKSFSGGRELARSLVAWGVPAPIDAHVGTFWGRLKALA